MNSAWLLWRGLVRLGYEQQAATLAGAITAAVSRAGLREFYDPYDGRGMGAGDFAWSALALEFEDPPTRAPASRRQADGDRARYSAGEGGGRVGASRPPRAEGRRASPEGAAR